MPIEERTLEEKVDKLFSEAAIHKSKIEHIEDRLDVIEEQLNED